jgi:peptide/nickel transport system permease protein
MLGTALGNSSKLAVLAFVVVVPLSILGGVIAALKRGTLIDRSITVFGLSATVIPEFVSGIVMIVLFAITLRWLPGGAQAPAGSGFFQQVRFLILPAIPLVLVLFGYIARITRAGMIDALDSDYTRTAILKGLPRRVVIRRHVLRNALLPTIAVVATQVGYLFGGLVAVEVLFNYQGVGRLIFDAAQKADLPLLAGGVLVIGVIYQVATLIADMLYGALNPRIRFGAET